MSKPDTLGVQVSAFESILRALIAIQPEEKKQEIERILTYLWDGVDRINTRDDAKAHLTAAREMSINITKQALDLKI